MGDFSNGGDDDHTAEEGREREREGERRERELFSHKVNNELSSGVWQRTCDIGGSSQELGEGDAIPGGSGSEVSVSPSSASSIIISSSSRSNQPIALALPT